MCIRDRSYIKASEIREILKVTEQEDVISFAGGLPAPELFPIDEINEINQIVLKEAGAKALQYTKMCIRDRCMVRMIG